jgi:hypothetical protein
MSVCCLSIIYAFAQLVNTYERAMFPPGAALRAIGVAPVGAICWRAAALIPEDSGVAAAPVPSRLIKTNPSQ